MFFTIISAVLLSHIYTCTYMCAYAAQPSINSTSASTSPTTSKPTTTTEKPTTTLAPCIPSQPNYVKIVTISTSSLNVAWDAQFCNNTESITYKISLRDLQNPSATNQSLATTSTWIQFSELRSGNPYEASVSACINDQRCSNPRTNSQYTYPEKPVNISVNPISTSQLSLSLFQNGSAVGYNILVNGSNATFIPSACREQALCTGNVNLTVENLSVAGGCYILNIKAKAGELESNSSESITGCTLPPDPGDLSCIAKDNSSFVVLIPPPQLNPLNYTIQSYILEYWEESPYSNFIKSINVTGSENTTKLNPLNSGYSYRIKVTSLSNGFKSSGASNVSCTTNLKKPTIKSVDAMESSILVKWSAPPSTSNFDKITGKCQTSVGKNSNFNSSKTDLENFCSDVTPGALYNVTVATALNDASLADPADSQIQQVVAKPSTPNNVTSTSVSESSITVSITYPSSAILCTEYKITAAQVLNNSPEQTTTAFCNSTDVTHIVSGLQSNTQYNISVFAIKGYPQEGLSGESQPTYVSVRTLKKPGGSGQGWIAGVVIGVVAFVTILVILGFLVYRQRLVQKKSKSPVERLEAEYEHGITEVPERPPTIIERPDPVSLEDFDEKVELLHKDSDFLFTAEFETLASMSADHPMTVSELQVNRVKNRYYNTRPYDHARVVLSKNDDDDTEEGNDYINASFVPGYNSRREFIAAQGPMKSTVDDFWRMIWEQNVHIIVMVTNLQENKKEKCYQYWPSDQESVFYGDIQVNFISEETYNCYVLRHLEVRKGNKGRKISQYHHTKFLDFGTPDNADEFVEFVQEIQKAKQQLTHKNTLKPTIAHCSAGVGRTGTYILVDHLIHLIINKEENIDIFGIILNMRDNRPSMVQNLKQYIFAHECVQIALERGLHKTAVPNGNANTKEKPLIDLDQNAIYMNTLGSKDTSETSSEEHK